MFATSVIANTQLKWQTNALFSLKGAYLSWLESLVYTQNVGGSSPSAPTSLRPVSQGETGTTAGKPALPDGEGCPP